LGNEIPAIFSTDVPDTGPAPFPIAPPFAVSTKIDLPFFEIKISVLGNSELAS
jgi:hypothetical protein